jgi:hypothetical protein
MFFDPRLIERILMERPFSASIAVEALLPGTSVCGREVRCDSTVLRRRGTANEPVHNSTRESTSIMDLPAVLARIQELV